MAKAAKQAKVEATVEAKVEAKKPAPITHSSWNTVAIIAVGMLMGKLPSPFAEALGLTAAVWFLRKFLDPRKTKAE